MRLFDLIAIFIIPSFLATFVAADFHMFNCWQMFGLGTQQSANSMAIGVPSNQFNCNGIRSNPILQGLQRFVENGSTNFYTPGMCGMGRMDFYWNGSGFNMYVHGGDGKVIGTCVKGAGGKTTCPAAFEQLACTDDWVCLTSVCS